MSEQKKARTKKQVLFVEEYLKDLNASAAARRAGYSMRTAERMGAENLQKPGIAADIADALEKRTQRTQLDADWVLKRLAQISDADLSDLYAPSGELKLVAEWPEVWRRGLVTGVEAVELPGGVGVLRKVRFADRLKALELVGRHVNVGAWRDKVEMLGKNGESLSLSVTFATPGAKADD